MRVGAGVVRVGKGVGVFHDGWAVRVSDRHRSSVSGAERVEGLQKQHEMYDEEEEGCLAPDRGRMDA